jgi:hypothetical protein
MKLTLQDNTEKDNSVLSELMNQFFPYSQERLGFDKPVSAELASDRNNAANPLGKTAYYDPNKMHIVLFTDERHPKDVLRSFSHELVHHAQNCRGEFDNLTVAEEGYAQKNQHLREMEKEAYLEGQLILRDWEDSKKETKTKMDINEETIRNIARRVLESVMSEGSKPDFLDLDKDGDKEEPMKDAAESTNEAVEEAHCGKRDDEETMEEAHCGKRDDEETLEEEESLEEGGAAARTGNEDRDQGRDRMHADRLHESQKSKSNYELFLQKKNSMLFDKLTKKWCK